MSRSLKIAFYAGKCLPVHANSLAERPLGGTETALIRVAALMSQRGHAVTIYTSHREPLQSNPIYKPALQVSELCTSQAEPIDAFIMLKEWWPAFFGVRTKIQLFWTGDSFDQFINFGLGDRRVVSRLSGFLAVSKWQAENLCRMSGFPHERTVVIGNGVELDYFRGEENRNRKRLIFTSAPYRGLALVPDIYRELRAKDPEVELHIFSGLSIYDTDMPFAGPEQKQYEDLVKELSQLPGCVVHGNIKQAELAREFMRSGILFYPNTFLETSCISVLEARAGGCAVVTSKRGALPESVGPGGIVVEGEPGTPEYKQAFVAATLGLCQSPDRWHEISAANRKFAQAELGWDRVADRLEAALLKVCKL